MTNNTNKECRHYQNTGQSNPKCAPHFLVRISTSFYSGGFGGIGSYYHLHSDGVAIQVHGSYSYTHIS